MSAKKDVFDEAIEKIKEDEAALVVQPDGGHLAGLYPEGVPRGLDAGRFDDDSDEMLPPRLFVTQDKSDVVQDGHADPGAIYSEAHQDVIQQPALVTPILVTREWCHWDGPYPDGKVDWKTRDPRDERLLADPESYKLKVHHWLMAIWQNPDGPGDDKLAVLSLKRSAMPASRQLYRAIGCGRYPGRDQIHQMRVVPDPKRRGNWVPSFKFAGYLDLERARFTHEAFEQFGSMLEKASVDVEQEAEDADAY